MIVPETDNPAIRERIPKDFRIIYLLNVDRIAVLSVFKGHRLLRESNVFSQ